jgi:voltage-gated potassium channel
MRAGLSPAHIRIWLGAVIGAVVIGTLGYLALLRWDLSDSLYMTVITLTTVGFGEVRPLDELGRAWTIVVTIAGVGIIGGTIGIIAEVALNAALRERPTGTEVRSLRDHFVVCGYGRVGATTAAELALAGVTTVVVEIDPVAQQHARRNGFIVVDGDATDDGILEMAGIGRCHGVVATMDADVKNVYLTLSARALKPGVLIVARASSSAAEARLRQAGADHVVSPYATAGRRIAQLALGSRAPE